MINFDGIKGAIFDVDGTMLDSMWMLEIIEADYLKGFGFTPSLKEVELMNVLSLRELAEYFRSEYGIAKTVQEIIDERNALTEEFYFEKAALKRGVIELLEKLRERDVKMCVATATDKYLVEASLKRLDILKYFGKIFTCGDEKTSKSSPDIFIRAAGFLGTKISETIVFEDAVHAIKSAKSAGFPVVAVYDKSADLNNEEIRQLADYYLDSMEEII